MLQFMSTAGRQLRLPVRSRHASTPVVLAMAAALLAPTQTASSAVLPTSTTSDRSAVTLRPVGGQMREGDVPLPARPALRTWHTGPVSMVAATWSGALEPSVEVSTSQGANWSRWRTLPVLEDGPTQGSSESNHRRGTDLVWIKQADDVRVRTSGAVPDDLELVLVDTSATDSRSSSAHRPAGSSRAGAAVRTGDRAKKKPDSAPRPTIRPRSRWEANEKWRSSPPVHNRRTRQVHIHHTANGNDYSRTDVPGMLRAIYRYHTKTLGWSDIGYNALVDRFGRAWSGRFNGPRSQVRGAHTLGFNHNSTGVAVLGDYSDHRPRPAVVRTLARIAAWQLDRHGRDAVGKVRVTSQGSDRYEAGRRVRLPVIDGHRRTNQTACPGDGLAKLLPTIRRKAQRRIDRF